MSTVHGPAHLNPARSFTGSTPGHPSLKQYAIMSLAVGFQCALWLRQLHSVCHIQVGIGMLVINIKLAVKRVFLGEDVGNAI